MDAANEAAAVPSTSAAADPESDTTEHLTVQQVIDRELGLDHGPEDEASRSAMADELAYQWAQRLRGDAVPGEDPELDAAVQQLATIPEEDKRQIAEQADAASRQLLEPLAYKRLQLLGVDPTTATPTQVRDAMRASLTPQQQATLQQEYERAFDTVFAPVVREALAEAGVQVPEGEDPSKAWAALQKAAGVSEEQEGSERLLGVPVDVLRIAVPAAVVGAFAALGLAKLVAWVKGRRRRQRQRRDQGGGRQGAAAGGSRQGQVPA